MRKKKPQQPDSRQVDIFEMIGQEPAFHESTSYQPVADAQPKRIKTGQAEKESLKKILQELKEIEKVLHNA